jgi:uncharacterized protein
MDQIEKLVRCLELQPHPEGGFYAETWRSRQTTTTPRGIRQTGTAIYFLLTNLNFSAFHRIQSDEIWHFYEGGSLHVHIIDEAGKYSRIALGPNLEAGEVYQAVVPAGCWFASESVGEPAYALAGCTVSPGFDFADFELADRSTLQLAFPLHANLIARLTRLSG